MPGGGRGNLTPCPLSVRGEGNSGNECVWISMSDPDGYSESGGVGVAGGQDGNGWAVAALVDHDSTLESDDDFAALVEAGGADSDDADVGTGLRCARFEDFGLGVDGIALEDGVGETHFIPAEVGEGVLRDVGDALAGDESQGEGGVHQRLAEGGL